MTMKDEAERLGISIATLRRRQRRAGEPQRPAHRPRKLSQERFLDAWEEVSSGRSNLLEVLLELDICERTWRRYASPERFGTSNQANS